jgi:arylsulfatase A-like enzyme
MMNLVVIVADTFRHDHVSGISPDSKLETPCLERFAKNSVIFDDFHTGSFPTLPHRTDCFTGKFLCMEKGWAPLDQEVPTLAGMLTDKGYRTQLIANCPHLMSQGNYYQRGFQFYHWVRGQEADPNFSAGNAAKPAQPLPDVKTRHTFPEAGNGEWNLGSFTKWQHGRWQWEEDYQPAETGRLASKWLEWNHADGPFFLWVDFFDPHEPWDVPDYLVKRFDPDYDGIPMIHPNYGPADVYTTAELRNMQAHYKAEAYLVDKWVGHVIQKIEDLGIMDNTMVVFTTDHGIYIGEHNRTGKSNIYGPDKRHWPIYEELCHIPFMVQHPKAKGGRHVKGFAQPVDLTATLLDQASVRPPKEFHGTSLLPMVEGKSRRGPRKYAVCCDKTSNPVVITDKWLYHPVGEGKKPALYDRKADPLSKKNLAKKNPKEAAKMHKLCIKFFKDNGASDAVVAQYL